jgi:uracil-DNA glycosylase family 4
MKRFLLIPASPYRMAGFDATLTCVRLVPCRAHARPGDNAADVDARAGLETLNRRIVRCRRCPRLVRHREAAAAEPPRRHHGETYWARPLPGFGDPHARLLLVGLAPAAHGGNRTGRIFTGDRSGDWLFRALWETGFANQPTSVHRDDGLQLTDAYITATVRCAPPDNKPAPDEVLTCEPYLLAELRLLSRLRVVVGLGRIGWQAYLRARRRLELPRPVATPVFAHGAVTQFADDTALIASYHPSQQNTFTGKLTREMLRSVFETARNLICEVRR